MERNQRGEAVSLSREEIIRMAMEAGLYDCIVFGRIESKDTVIKRFANAAYAAGAAAEREECANICDGWTGADGDRCAEAIRARGNGASHEQN